MADLRDGGLRVARRGSTSEIGRSGATGSPAIRLCTALIAAASLACGGGADPEPGPRENVAPPHAERTALGAAFIGGNPRGLRGLLHPDLVVQPPAPDSAVQGAAAIEYLLGLAAHSEVRRSWLDPQAVSPEGVFLLEQGTWLLLAGERSLASRYHLRWRQTADGWRVVLWRWTPFR